LLSLEAFGKTKQNKQNKNVKLLKEVDEASEAQWVAEAGCAPRPA
jgi:hypothetical protein